MNVCIHRCSSGMYYCIITLLDSGVKGMLREQEHSNEWDIHVLKVHVCAKGINCPTARYLCTSKIYLHTAIYLYLSDFHHIEGVVLFVHKVLLSCNSGLILGTLCNLISCNP